MAMPVGIPHFEVHGDVATRDTRWKKWHSNFERAMVGYDIKDPTRKRALLLFYGGQDLQDEFATLPETSEDKDYDMCVSRKISDVAIE